MKKPNSNPEDSANLRQKAEEQIKSRKSKRNKAISETDLLKLIHELEVHQIELELQNEELTLANDNARAATEKYEELYDFAPSGYFTLSCNGSILEINLRGAQMLGKQRSLLINSQFGFFVEEDSRFVFANFLDEIFRGKSHVTCELSLVSSDDNNLHVQLTGIMSDTKEQCRITAIDITERKNAEDDLRKNLAKYKVLIDTFPIAITISDKAGKIIETNEKALELLGLSREEHLKRKLKGEEWTIIKPDGTVFPQEEYASVKALNENRLVENVEMGLVKPGEETTWINVTAAPIPIEDHGVLIAYNDITERKKSIIAMEQIEWMLSEKKITNENFEPDYGDLSKLNKNGLILNSVGKEQLVQIASEYLDLLETSSAIYEKNGDYALGLFSSSWCQKMDAASRKLCNTDNLTEALQNGKWLCHESCWHDASLKAISSGKPADVECKGGIRLFAVPIHANGEVIGAINFGYGEPPKTETELQQLSALYQIPVEELRTARREYQIRPQYIIDYAKKRIEVSARYIGNLIERRQSEILLQEKNEEIEAQNEELFQANQELIEAKQKAEESDEKYKALFYNAPLSYQSLDEDGCLIDVNPMWLKTLGYDRSEVIGKWYGDFLHPDFVEHFRINFPAFKKRGSVSDVQFKMRRKDTTCIDVSFEGCVGYTPDGKFKQTYCVFKDITEQKALENALVKSKEKAVESEERLRKSIENSPVPIAIADEDGKLIFLNNQFVQVFGYTLQEIPSMEVWFTKAYPDAQYRNFIINDWGQEVEQSIKNNVPIRNKEYLITCKNGEIKTVALSAYFDKGTSYGIFQDVTEQKQAEQELAESAERYKSLHNASFGGIAIHDKGVILECNQGLSEMTGYSLNELIGMDGLLLIAPQHREMVMNEIISGNEKPYEANGLRKNGEQFPMRLEARGIPYKGKNVRTVEFRDITETKLAETALRKSEAKLSALFSSMSEMVVLHELVFDGEGTPVNYLITDCNEAFTKITGIPRNNAIGKLGTEVYGTGEPPYFTEFAEVAITGETYCFETYFDPLGKHLSISVVCPDKNHFATVTADITERKLAELLIQDKSEEIAAQNEELNQANLELIAARQKAEESEARFRNLMESIDAVAVQGYGPDGITQFWNKASEKLYGYSQQEAIGASLLDLIIPDEMKDAVSSAIDQMAATGKPVSGGELLLKHKDGSLVPVISHHSIVKVPGHDQELFCLDVDITQLKILETELKESEERFNLAMKATNDGLFDWNLVTNEIYYSPAWKKMLGYEDHELPNDFTVWEKTTAPEDVKRSWELQQKLILKQVDRFVMEFKMQHKDGHWVDILSRAEAFFNNSGEAVRMVGTHTDITERKRSEMLIKEYSGRLELTMESANMAWWELDLVTGKVIFNRNKTDMLGYSQDQFHHYTDFTKLVHPDDYEPMMSSMQTLLDDKVEKYNIEYRIKAQSGEYIWFHDIGIISKRTNKGEPSTVSGIVLNITERKHAEEEIKKTGLHYQALIEKAPDGIALIDAGGNFKYISPSAKRMFGYNPSDEITGHPNEYTHPDDLPFVLSVLEKIFKDPTYITTIEYRLIDKSGNWHWIETTFSNLLANPSVESIILNFRDITERKHNEQAINLSEEKFRKAFITSPDSININRLEDGMYVSINKGFTQITGYTEAEVQMKTSVEINIWATDNERKKVNDEIKSKGYVENLEVKFRKKDGKLVDGLMSASIIELEGVPHILSITRDITERKQAETKLHQSEERYALVIEASEQGIWDWNVETDEVFYSEQWKKQIGYKDDELKNEFGTWIEHLHPDEKEYCLNAVNSYLKQPVEHLLLDFRFRHKDGTYRWIHNKAASIINDEGKVIRLFGTHTDFTESKLSESIINDIIEKNPMSIQILDMEGYPVQVNPAHTKLFGVEPPADYSVFKDTQLLSLGFGELFERIKRGEVVFFPDSYYNVHDVDLSFPDSPAWVKALGFTLNDNNGKPNKIVLMHENITERKNAEALLNDIIENNPMSIQVVDKEGHTLRGNPAFIQLFGSVPPPEFSIFEDLRNKSTELENLVSRVKDGEIVHLPDVYFNAHDAVAEAPDIPLWIRAMIFPLKDSAGKPERFVFMHENITERKLYEAEIHTLNEQLEQRVIDRTAQLEAANKELEAFSYSVSHDLRTPLRALNGFATILTEDYSIVLDEEGKRLLSVISENATKMGFLIDDLLSFSRLGRIEMLPSLINMKTMAETVYNELVPETEKDKISFMLGNIPDASGDSSMVKQVWVNLIGNAIKFTSKKTDRHIEVGVMAGKNENVFYVKDNGAGFEMAHAAKLFGVFQRLHTLKEFDGIGAGLAIVRRIILRHNGRVWAEGKVNEGATFYFSLPVLK